MSKTNKVATFTLEPDGFAIHTFELSSHVSYEKGQAMIDDLFQKLEAGDKLYRDGGIVYCGHFVKQGLRICIIPSTKRSFVIRIIVNPRKLFDTNASYRGIFQGDRQLVDQVMPKIHKVLKKTRLAQALDSAILNRIDVCTNIACDNDKVFRETIRVMRKLPAPAKYERLYSKLKNKEKAKIMDKHYIHFACKSKSIVLYDKSGQMISQSLLGKSETLPKGVLRIEIQYGRDEVLKVTKAQDLETVADQLWYFMDNAQSLLVDTFKRCFFEESYCQKEEIERRIQSSKMNGVTKKTMMDLSHAMTRRQSVEKVLVDFEKRDEDTKQLLQNFQTLGVSPVPLWKNFRAKEIPGPVLLLEKIVKGDVEIEKNKNYVKI